MRNTYYNLCKITCRKIVAVAAALSCAAAINVAHAQSLSNYIRTKTYTAAGASSYRQDITYYDGLGYGVQSLQVAGSPLGHTLSSQTVYDCMHRPDSVAYLPFARTDGGSTMDSLSTALSAQAAWYAGSAHGYSDSRPFSVKDYETSKYGRPLSIQREGDLWNAGGGHRVSFTYGFNGSADDVLKLKYEPAVTSGPGSRPARVSCCEEWPYASLSRTRTTDEEGAVTDTYTDPSGRRVCTRSWTGPAAAVGGPGTGTMSETLYAYDHRDSLVLVVQPEGTAALRALSPADRVITLVDDPVNANNDIFSGYCFSFTYDGWGNILSGHTPGGGTVQYAYDARDRLVLRTDPKMSPDPGNTGGKMVLTLHDQYDRVVEERYVSSPQASFETIRSNFRSTVTHTLSPSYITGILPTQQVLRTAEYFPYGSITYATSGDGAFIPDSGIVTDSDVEKTNVKGLLRQETVYPAPGPDGTIPAGALSVTRYYHYDYNGRVVQMKEVWSDGHSRRLSTKYSFTGDVMATKETLSGPESTSITTTYTRDSRGRILSVSRNVGGTSMAPVTYGYDELGRLVSKSVGDSDDPMLETAFGYDIHGWMTSVSSSIGNTSVFSETLRYASAAKDQSAVRYDGNISEITAVHGSLSNDTYAYHYDGMKRLLGADRYIGSSSSGSLTLTEGSMAYDRNGNLTALKRYGDTGLDNDLTFTLTGNRMTGLSDAGTPGGSFTYAYDAMGNQTSDGRKGLQISYNILNLPCGVTSAASSSLTYSYLSDGTKVSAVREDGSGKRYLGSAVYSVPESLGESGGGGSETLESVAWDEGRIFFDEEVPVDSTGNGLVVVDSIPGVGCYRDCWYVTDHIGNVRSVVDISSSLASPLVVERNDYLPYGTRLGVGNAVLESNHYRLGAKEEQVFGGLDLGKVDFGARQYDPFIAGWTTIDPMADKYGSMSPYSYCAGNPVNMVDFDGRIPRIYIQRKGLGHVFVTTGEGNNTTVYTYGRYGALYKFFGSITSGSLTPFGEGVLGILKGKDAANYLESVLNKDNFDVFEFVNGDDSQINDYFSQRIQGCDTPSNPQKITYHNDLYHVIDIYDLLFNNCVTTTRSAVEKGDVQIDSNTSIPIVFAKGLSNQSMKDSQIKKVVYPKALVHYILYMINRLNNNEDDN
jgi:RHS repeat-associated protein